MRGIPSSLIVTDVFETRSKETLELYGYQHVPVLVTPNPVVYLQGPEIHKRTEDLLDRVICSLTSEL